MARKPKTAHSTYHLKVDVSKEAIEITKNIVSGKLTKYDSSVHCALLIDLFSAGHAVAAFCSHSHICRATFFDWVRDHDEFRQAYAFAKEKARAYLESLGMDNILTPGFNSALYQFIMRNRCDYTADRKVALKGMDKAKTHNERVKIVDKKVSAGELTLSEAKSVADYIAATAKIDEITPYAADIETLKQIVHER